MPLRVLGAKYNNHHLETFSSIEVGYLNRNWIIAVQSDGFEGSKYSNIVSNYVTKASILYCQKEFNNYKSSPENLINNLFHYIRLKLNDFITKKNYKSEECAVSLSVAVFNGNELYYGLLGKTQIIAQLEDGSILLLNSNLEDSQYLLDKKFKFKTGKLNEKVFSFLMISKNCVPSFETQLLKASQLYDGLYLPLVRMLLGNRDLTILEKFIKADLTFNDFTKTYRLVLEDQGFKEEIIQLIINTLNKSKTVDKLLTKMYSDRSLLHISNNEVTVSKVSFDQYVEPNWSIMKDNLNNLLYDKHRVI